MQAQPQNCGWRISLLISPCRFHVNSQRVLESAPRACLIAVMATFVPTEYVLTSWEDKEPVIYSWDDYSSSVWAAMDSPQGKRVAGVFTVRTPLTILLVLDWRQITSLEQVRQKQREPTDKTENHSLGNYTFTHRFTPQCPGDGTQCTTSYRLKSVFCLTLVFQGMSDETFSKSLLTNLIKSPYKAFGKGT